MLHYHVTIKTLAAVSTALWNLGRAIRLAGDRLDDRKEDILEEAIEKSDIKAAKFEQDKIGPLCHKARLIRYGFIKYQS